MNKRELVEAVASSTDLSAAAAERAIEALAEAITDALTKGDKVAIPGFGTFETRSRAARTGRNPQTGETLEIAASTSAAFKPATKLKQAVNGGK